MAATVQVAERNGAPAGVETVNPANLNFGSDDSFEIVVATYPLTAKTDGHSFEKWFRLYVSALGGSTLVDNFKVWASGLGGGYVAGEGLSTNLRTGGWVNSVYAAPIETDSVLAAQVMPITEPFGPNLGISGILSGSIIAVPNYSDYGIIQMDVTALTPAGAMNQKTFTFQWDEQ